MKSNRARALAAQAQPQPSPVPGRGSQADIAYLGLRKALRTGALRPGDRIVEAAIAEHLRVSRTPVRDAIRRLEAEGLLEYEPRAGLVVTKLDERAVSELYEMREVLEGTAARLFCRHASELEAARLVEFVEQEKRLQGDAAALARNNHNFHVHIYRGAHNRFLERALGVVNASLWLLGQSQMFLPHRAKQAAAEHAELAKAICKRDPDLAEALARKHVRSAQAERFRTLFADAD